MGDGPEMWLLEIRVFTLHPGVREEFHRTSVAGTVPLMRACGITVLASTPARNDDDGYVLLRAFRDEEERIALSQSLYVTGEWLKKYEDVVPAMVADYRTSVVPVPRTALERFARSLTGA